MYKTPNATYESLTDGRGAWGDDEPVWRSGDIGDAAWLQADFGENVTVNEIWVASGRDEVWGNCGNYSATEYYVNASVDCTEGSFIQIGSLGNVSAPNHTVGAPPERRWPDGADEVTARCFRIYPAGVGNGTDDDKSWGCLGEFRMEYRNPSPATCECESGACIWGEEATPRVEGGPVSRGPKGRYVRVVSPSPGAALKTHFKFIPQRVCGGTEQGSVSLKGCAARCAADPSCTAFSSHTNLGQDWTSTSTARCILSYATCTGGSSDGYLNLFIKRQTAAIELDGHFIAWNVESLERFDESGMPEDLQLAVAATASSVTGVDPINDPACYTYDWDGVDPAERHDACDVNVGNLNSLNDPYVATDKKAPPLTSEWIELDLGEDKVVDGVHIKFSDEDSDASSSNDVTMHSIPYFEILDANRDVVYNSSQRCNEKNCVLDLTNGPDAHPRDAGNDRLSDTSFDDPYDYTGLFYGGRSSNCANLPDGGVSQCKAECDCTFDSGCTKGSGGVCGYDCTGACYCNCAGAGGWANAGTLERCHAYCDLAYVHVGDKTAATAAAAAAAAAARSGREKAFDWDLVVAHHSKWRNEIAIPPYYSVSLVATIGESLAAGNAVKSEEFPLGSTPASVECSDEGFGIVKNNRTFAPDAKTKACWCRTRGLPVTKRWCDMKSDPEKSDFDPPDLEHPSCTNRFGLFEDQDNWVLIAAYNHQANTNPSLVEGVFPESPTEGFSHVWPGTHLGLTAADIAEVRFYCHTSKHNRVVHFSTKNEWVRNRILVGGSFPGNSPSHWNSGTTKLEGHTGFLPDATTQDAGSNIIGEFPFIGGGYHFAISGHGTRWECDDLHPSGSPAHTTLHQVWIKLAR